MCCVFFLQQKTAYELRISDWSSDVCSSDLSGSAASNVRSMVDLPAPEVEERTNRTPRRLKSGVSMGMLSAMAASAAMYAIWQGGTIAPSTLAGLARLLDQDRRRAAVGQRLGGALAVRVALRLIDLAGHVGARHEQRADRMAHDEPLCAPARRYPAPIAALPASLPIDRKSQRLNSRHS